MSRTCTLCRHTERPAIEAALAARVSYRDIARRYGTTASAVSRHRAHVAQAVEAVQADAELTHAERLLAELAGLRESALAMLTRAEKGDDERTVALALRECRACLELQGKLVGVLTPGGNVAVGVFTLGAVPTDPTAEQVAWAAKVLDAQIGRLEAQRHEG